MHLPAASKGNPGPMYFIELSCAIEHRCTMYEELTGGGGGRNITQYFSFILFVFFDFFAYCKGGAS